MYSGRIGRIFYIFRLKTAKAVAVPCSVPFLLSFTFFRCVKEARTKQQRLVKIKRLGRIDLHPKKRVKNKKG